MGNIIDSIVKQCFKPGLYLLYNIRGFVCVYHPAAPSLNPKHNIYASIFQFKLQCGNDENKPKRGRDWPKNNSGN